MMQPLAYLHLQMRLEGIEIAHSHFMRQVQVVPGEKMPLILIARLADKGTVLYYDEGIAPDLPRKLDVIGIDFPNIDCLLDILKLHDISFEVGHYKTYIFPFPPVKDMGVIGLSGHDPAVKAFRFDGLAEQVYALKCNDQIVSACVSTRENKKCGEAWVYTAPAYRRQGFAQKVVNAWARDLMNIGKVPFYSHALRNTASASLAGKLGLQPVFEEICITQT